MKYARIVEGRAVDLVDTDNYNPRPEWGQTDIELIDRIFEAVGGYGAFTMVPSHVKSYENVTQDGEFETDAKYNARLEQMAQAQAYAEEIAAKP